MDKELAKKTISPFYFTDENLNLGFKIHLESHNIIHAKSLLTITQIYPGFGIETRCINKIRKEMVTFFYARLINQGKFKYHKIFSASFYKINEEDQ